MPSQKKTLGSSVLRDAEAKEEGFQLFANQGKASLPGAAMVVEDEGRSKLTDKHRDILNSVAEGLGVKLDMPKGGMIKKHQNILNAVTEALAP